MRRAIEAILSFCDTGLFLDFFGANRTLESHDSRNENGSVHESVLVIIHRGDKIEGEVKDGPIEKLVDNLLLFFFVRDFDIGFQDDLTGLS